MARVTLNKKFEKYTGTPPPNGSRFYLTNRFGETIMSHYPMHRDPESITPNQKASCGVFAQARRIADAEGLKYKTLRGFTIAQVRKQLENGQAPK